MEKVEDGGAPVASRESGEFAGTARFDVRRRVGAGAMGVVYEAWDRVRSEFVALKTLRHLDAAAIYRLKQEFRALADVAHPNLVSLQELLVEGEHWFFTMELVRGVDFLSWVRPGWSFTRPPPGSTQSSEDDTEVPPSRKRDVPRVQTGAPGPGILDEPRFRAALLQLCGAVAALHEGGRVHRDLKPSNVLVESNGRVVVLDFGLMVDLQHSPTRRSLEHGIAGTPEYMAPEQAALEPVGPAADWYALGVMMYEALTGRAPFAGRQLQVLMDKQHLVPVEPLELAPGAPPDLCALCADLLRRHPEQRPSGADVLRRLGRAVGKPPSVPSVGRLPLVGQLPVLAALQDAFTEVRKGQAATVILHGSAGVGVSTVARSFAELAESEAQAVVLLGRCYERESVPFKGLDSLVDALSRYLRRMPRAEVEALLPRDVHALVRMFPVLRRVDAVADAPRRSTEAPDPQELRRRGAAALRELLGRIADRKPLVLLIDGLQWSDRDSVALLSELLRAPDAPPMLLVGCYRHSLESDSPAPRYAEASTEPLFDLRAQLAAVCVVREIEVRPLDALESGHLASLLLSRANLPLSLADSVARESRGSPFLVHELVRALQVDEAGHAIGEDVTLARAIRMRLAQLPAPARALLEVVALGGGPTVTAVAAHAAGLEGDARATFSLLRAAHLLRTSVDGDRVEPYHDRIRETVVSAMEPPRQVEAHLKLAAALETRAPDAAQLALHYAAAGHPHRAAEYAAAAAERAAETLAFERAARLYQLALSLRAPEPGWGLELEIRQGDALAAAGFGALAAEIYLRAAARSWATRAQVIELQRRAAEQYLRSGHIDEGLDVLRSVLAAYGMRIASTPRRALFTLLLRRAQVRIRGTRVVPRDVSQVSAEDLARIDVCWAGAIGLAMVDTIRGSAFQAEHLLLSLEAGEPVRIARAFALEAPFAALTGRPRARRAAQKLVGQAHELARRLDQPQITALAGLTAAVVDFLGGRWRSCHQQAEEAATLFRDRCTGVAWELSNCQLFSLWSLFYLGELGELRLRAEALRREAVARGDLYAATIFRTGLTNLASLVGDDIAGARREVTEVGAHWSQRGFHFQHYWGLLAEGLTDLYAGAGAAAHERIERLWPELERTLMLRIQNVAVEATHLRARSALAALDGSAADARRLAAVERDARKLAAVPAPWSRALATLLEAGLNAARGDGSAAVDLFAIAADQLGALDMSLFAAAARRRIGELRGEAAFVAAADEMMEAQGIANPARMAALLAP